MARVVYKKIPQASIVDLTDIDLRILDQALSEYLDRRKKDGADRLYVLTAQNLHDCVLRIKAGEDTEIAD